MVLVVGRYQIMLLKRRKALRAKKYGRSEDDERKVVSEKVKAIERIIEQDNIPPII